MTSEGQRSMWIALECIVEDGSYFIYNLHLRRELGVSLQTSRYSSVPSLWQSINQSASNL